MVTNRKSTFYVVSEKNWNTKENKGKPMIKHTTVGEKATEKGNGYFSFRQ